MRIFAAAALAAAILSMGPFSAVAQTMGDPAEGRDYALQSCTQCHIVAANQPMPKKTIAPDFRSIADTKGMTETALHAFLSSPHPTMPNLILSQREQDDVIAYIASLRSRK